MHRDLRNVVQCVAAGYPTSNAIFEECVNVFNADARQSELRFAQMLRVFSDEDDALVQSQNPGSPGGVLPGQADVNRSGDMGHSELRRWTRIKNDCAFRLQSENFGSANGHWRRYLVEFCSTLSI